MRYIHGVVVVYEHARVVKTYINDGALCPGAFHRGRGVDISLPVIYDASFPIERVGALAIVEVGCEDALVIALARVGDEIEALCAAEIQTWDRVGEIFPVDEVVGA